MQGHDACGPTSGGRVISEGKDQARGELQGFGGALSRMEMPKVCGRGTRLPTTPMIPCPFDSLSLHWPSAPESTHFVHPPPARLTHSFISGPLPATIPAPLSLSLPALAPSSITYGNWVGESDNPPIPPPPVSFTVPYYPAWADPPSPLHSLCSGACTQHLLPIKVLLGVPIGSARGCARGGPTGSALHSGGVANGRTNFT